MRRTLLCCLPLLWLSLTTAKADSVYAPLFLHEVPLAATHSGGYVVEARLSEVSGQFLLDTGASMITLNRDFFEQVRKAGEAKKMRQVVARFASGKTQTMDVYQVERFTLGAHCEIGPIEVAVMKRGGRNLLGMNALTQAAPFTVSLSPPALGLSRCAGADAIATR
ncbi:MAG: retropepsin-like aspartic protease [Pseudomonadota bacterium]